jgi:predicted transcriptional regulator of viral defense system
MYKMTNMDFREQVAAYAEQPLTRQLLMELLKDYKRPYDKINELVKQNLLTQVKRGVFIPGPALKIAGPEKFLLANHLWGPSYISSDTALSHWGLIPERVYEISSMTTNISKTYKTPAGRFRYYRLPLPYYSFGQQQVELTPKQRILMAGPEKALCDKIITTPRLVLRSARQTRDYLTEDLRIEKTYLRDLNIRNIKEWIKEAPKEGSISILYKTLNEL